MRDKLLELLNQINPNIKNETIADYLIENGVYCTPCRVGDYIEWRNPLGDIILLEVKGFKFDKYGQPQGYITKYSDIQPLINSENIIRIIPKEN